MREVVVLVIFGFCCNRKEMRFVNEPFCSNRQLHLPENIFLNLEMAYANSCCCLICHYRAGIHCSGIVKSS